MKTKTSRVAIFHGSDRPLSLESVPVPAPGPGQILVRNAYVTLCRSDLNTFSGKRTEKTPTILGHEVVGHIDAFGPGTPTTDARGAELQVGDLVTWAIYSSNPASPLSRAGLPQKADGLFKYGHERIESHSHLHGGLADYCLLRAHTPVVRLDPSISLPVLALLNCAVATVAGALRIAGDLAHRQVIVAGAGMLGLVACAMCRTAGARRILAIDVDEARLEVAHAFGVDAVQVLDPNPPPDAVLALPIGPRAIALDFSGVPETMELLARSLEVGGTLVLVGATFPQRPIQLEAEQIVRRLLCIRGLHNYAERDLVAAVEFIETHHARFPFGDLIADGFDLEQVNEAFSHGLSSGSHRVGVRCGRTE